MASRSPIAARPASEAAGRDPDPPLVESSPMRFRIAAFVLHVVAFAPLTCQALLRPTSWPGPNDFTKHATIVVDLTFVHPPNPGPPYFIWHLLVKLVDPVAPGGRLHAAVVVTLAFAGLTGVVWFEVLRMRGPSGFRLSPRLALVGSLLLVCMETPAVLGGWERLRTQVFVPLYAYHNGSGLAVRPFAALTVWFLTAACTAAPGSRRRRTAVRLLPVVVLLTTFTRPSLLPPLIPATLLIGWWWARESGRSWWAVVGPFVRRALGPVVVLLAFQYVTMASVIPEEYRISTVIRPFDNVIRFGAYRPTFWLVVLLPAAALLTWRRRLLADPHLQLLLVAAAIGVASLCVLSSSAPDRTGPEALWFVVTPMQLIVLFGARRVAELVATDWRPADRFGARCTAAVAALFVVSFAAFTSCQLGGPCLT